MQIRREATSRRITLNSVSIPETHQREKADDMKLHFIFLLHLLLLNIFSVSVMQKVSLERQFAS